MRGSVECSQRQRAGRHILLRAAVLRRERRNGRRRGRRYDPQDHGRTRRGQRALDRQVPRGAEGVRRGHQGGNSGDGAFAFGRVASSPVVARARTQAERQSPHRRPWTSGAHGRARWRTCRDLHRADQRSRGAGKEGRRICVPELRSVELHPLSRIPGTIRRGRRRHSSSDPHRGQPGHARQRLFAVGRMDERGSRKSGTRYCASQDCGCDQPHATAAAHGADA